MENTDRREELVMMVRQLPDDSMEKACELIEILIENKAEDIIILEPIDEEHMKPEFKERLQHSRDEIARGEVLSLDRIAKDFGYGG